MRVDRESRALVRLRKNLEDVDRLLEIHGEIGGAGRGRKYGVEVLNKSAVVLICACWEAYNEDVCAEAIEHICKNARDSTKLPKDLKKLIAIGLEKDDHELAVWRLAGRGWRVVLKSNQQLAFRKHIQSLNTPKSRNLENLFRDCLGIDDITRSWGRPHLPAKNAKERIDGYVTLRGAIAHRGAALESVKKIQCTKFKSLVEDMAQRVDVVARKHVQSVAPLWIRRRRRRRAVASRRR